MWKRCFSLFTILAIIYLDSCFAFIFNNLRQRRLPHLKSYFKTVSIYDSITSYDFKPIVCNNDFEIKEARYPDLTGVVNLRVGVFYPECMTQYSFHSRILDKLRSRIDSGAVCLIAQRNFTGEVSPAGNLYFGNILGTVEFSASDFIHTPFENVGHERKLYVADLAVRQDARRRGIASKLLKIIEDYAVKYSYGSIYLHVEVNNSEALKLYTRNGYTLVPQDENVTLFTENRLQKSADLYHFLMKNVSATLNDDDESQILDFKL